MTREERGLAIGFFKFRRRIFCDNHLKNCPKNSNEYIATLIEKSFYDMAIKALEQEECEDAVSRQSVNEIINDIRDCISVEGYWAILERMKKLPSVNSQNIGHWIIEKWNNKEHYSCSSCQHVVDYEPCYHYCPYCGAKMVEPQESEE